MPIDGELNPERDHRDKCLGHLFVWQHSLNML